MTSPNNPGPSPAWTKARLSISTALLGLGLALFCSTLANVHAFAKSQVAAEHRMSEAPYVRDSTQMTLEQLAIQNVDPNRFALYALQGSPFAVTTSAPAPVKPGCEVLYIADPATTTSWFANEWERGSVPWNWPSLNSMLKGPTPSPTPPIAVLAGLHKKIREAIFFPNMLTDAAVSSKLPGIQATVERHLENWSNEDPASCFDGSMHMLFDIVANTVLQMGLDPDETKQFSDLMEVWNQGMVARVQSETDPVFGKAMEAREALRERFLQALDNPDLPEDSMLASFKNTLGDPYTEVIISQMLLLFFGSYETVPSVLCRLFWSAQQTPRVWQRIRNEQLTVQTKFGPDLSLRALKAMRYSTATVNESFRMAQAVSFSSRIATQPIEEPDLPAVKAGCPFVMAWGAMSDRDPAVAEDPSVFRPERWLDPKNIPTLNEYQIPMGKGTHGCPGHRLARATLLAVVREVGLKYSVSAEARLGFDEWPTGGRPINGLPLRLTPLPVSEIR